MWSLLIPGIVLLILLILAFLYQYPDSWNTLLSFMIPVLVFSIPSAGLIVIHLLMIYLDRYAEGKRVDRTIHKLNTKEAEILTTLKGHEGSIMGEIHEAEQFKPTLETMEQEGMRTIEGLKESFVKEKTSLDTKFTSLNEKVRKRISDLSQGLSKKLDKEVDTSGLRKFSQRVGLLNKSVEDNRKFREELKKENLKVKKCVGETLLVIDEVHKFYHWFGENFTLTKKQKKEVEEKLFLLRRRLSSGIKGSEYKKTLQEYQKLKQVQYQVVPEQEISMEKVE